MENMENRLSRKERERLLRREEILDAAKAVFAERGYSKATIEEIAHRAEFGKGTLYNYFPDGKEQILLAIFDQLYEGLRDLIIESFGSSDSLPFHRVMENFIERSFEFFSERFNLFLILIKEAQRLIFSDDRERSSYFALQQGRVMETLAAPLQDAMDRGELRKMSPNLLANLIFTNIKGVQMTQCLLNPNGPHGSPSHDTREMAAFLTEFILYGAAASKIQETA